MANDVDSEYRLLAALLDEPTYILKVNERLFTHDRIRLYRALRECWLVYGAVVEEGVERYYGGPLPQQLEIARGSKAAPIIDKLVTLTHKRQLQAIQIDIERLLAQQSIDLDDARRTLAFTPLLAAQDTSLATGVLEFVSELTRKRTGKYRFIRTGLDFLDYMLGGEWPRQGLTVVLGQAGGGKTALVCNSMLRMATAEQPIGSLFISLEMRKRQLVSRLVANFKQVDGISLRTGKIDDATLRVVEQGIEEIQQLPIYIDDRPGLTVNDIISQMREHRERCGVEVVFIDYLQIIGGSDADNQSEALGAIAQQLRNAAVELEMACVLLSQQNRGFQGLQSILGSGRVGHIADVCLEIKMPADSTGDYRLVTFDFVKNREGPLGIQSAPYYPAYLRYGP